MNLPKQSSKMHFHQVSSSKYKLILKFISAKIKPYYLWYDYMGDGTIRKSYQMIIRQEWALGREWVIIRETYREPFRNASLSCLLTWMMVRWWLSLYLFLNHTQILCIILMFYFITFKWKKNRFAYSFYISSLELL